METQTFSDVYVQTRRVSDNRSIGFVATHNFSGWKVYEYDLTENNAVLNRIREFGDNGNSYENFQRFVEQKTGAEALPYDPDNGDMNVFGALEQALKAHIDLSN